MSEISRSVELTPDARADFTSIMLDSVERWGERQRDVYSARLTNALEELALFPHLGAARDDIAIGLRGLRIERHILYYRLTETEVVVIRILHHKMDAARHVR